MAQTLKIFGQNKPDAGFNTNLFTVTINNQAQVSIFVANQSNVYDRFTIALIPEDQSEQPENYIAYNTYLYPNGIFAFSGLYFNSGDRVQISSENGNCSFTATGIEFLP